MDARRSTPPGFHSRRQPLISRPTIVNGTPQSRTVFFWAPLGKWALVIGGLKDLQRPADKLSVAQNLALAATGFIWVRYSLVITPINYSLAAVNFCVGTTGLMQLYRVWDWRRKNPVMAAIEEKVDSRK